MDSYPNKQRRRAIWLASGAPCVAFLGSSAVSIYAPALQVGGYLFAVLLLLSGSIAGWMLGNARTVSSSSRDSDPSRHRIVGLAAVASVPGGMLLNRVLPTNTALFVGLSVLITVLGGLLAFAATFAFAQSRQPSTPKGSVGRTDDSSATSDPESC